MGDLKVKERKFSWAAECYKADPSLLQPKPVYVFNKGKRVFYSNDRSKRAKQ